MPLEFQSLSHGPIAFGFFNIESDMLLLDRYFLFADDFCGYVSSLATEAGNGESEKTWNVYFIERGEDIGNLMGAIHGMVFQGFIGEVYKLFPFPQEQEGFKQKPYGSKNRSAVETLIQRYGRRIDISVVVDGNRETIAIGDYAFTRSSFQELIKYVWRGGYPRWQDEVRPDCVLAMKETIEGSNGMLFDGLQIEMA
jgi:hypothetical protein